MCAICRTRDSTFAGQEFDLRQELRQRNRFCHLMSWQSGLSDRAVMSGSRLSADPSQEPQSYDLDADLDLDLDLDVDVDDVIMRNWVRL